MPNSSPEDDFLTLLDALAMGTDPMFAINDRNRIVFWNRGMKRTFGYDADEVMGKSCAGILAGNDAHGNRYCSDACPIVQIAKRDEPVRQFELEMKAKDGTTSPMELTVLKFVMPSTKRFLLVHVVRPIARPRPAEPLQEIAPQSGLAASMRGSGDARVRELTNRECEILGMLAGGMRTADIAAQLCISPLTARNHIQKVFAKLEVHSQAEAVAFVYKMRLV